jgi:hypothetical protein
MLLENHPDMPPEELDNRMEAWLGQQAEQMNPLLTMKGMYTQTPLALSHLMAAIGTTQASAATAGAMVLGFADAEMVLWLGGASTGLSEVTFDESRPMCIGRCLR